jgi:hypothetical protein
MKCDPELFSSFDFTAPRPNKDSQVKGIHLGAIRSTCMILPQVFFWFLYNHFRRHKVGWDVKG